MTDIRMHNDCDGGACAACNWDAAQEVARGLARRRQADLDLLNAHGLQHISVELERLRNLEAEFFELCRMSGAAT
mgnify:CR=1 FL=1